MDDLSLMEKFTNPELIGSMPFSEKMLGSLVTMVMGMGITFVVLVLLWGVIALLAKFSNSGAAIGVGAAGAAAAVASPALSTVSAGKDEGELAAVISAAIAAFEGERGPGGLVVRRISRVSGQASAWSNAGRSDCIGSRKR